ncbi:MAG TPA: hypothetical protein PL070_13825 [Flavobacteriales bacterium]|nr:hypothetical protein [Flavobacteriales bacterium]
MNQHIDHTNYEAWLLDRLEGNLTREQERALEAFLLLHPELAPLDDELPTVQELKTSLSSADKNALKRTLPPVGLVKDSTVEDHLIARLEGDLDAEQHEALRLYLLAHPEWQQAEKSYALTKLVPQAMAYAAKGSLERHLPPQGLPTEHTLTDFLIARLEGDLTADQLRAVEQVVASDPAYQRTADLVNATRVHVAPVVFADKANLKKKEGRVIAFSFNTWSVRLAAAASIALLFAVGMWFLRSPELGDDRYARVPTPQNRTKGTPVPEKEHGEQERTDVVLPVDDATPTQAPSVHDASKAPFTPARVHEQEAPTPVQPRELAPTPVEEPALAEVPQKSVSEPISGPDKGYEAGTPEETFEALAHQPARTETPAPVNNERTMGEVLASALRERVLDAPARQATPLDGADAVAAVDRTLKAVGGERTGLAVQRKDNGAVNGFNLRLGRNFAISASR